MSGDAPRSQVEESAARLAGRPAQEYAGRLAGRRAEEARLGARAGLLSNLRLAVFATGIVVAILAFGPDTLPRRVVWLPVGLFAVLVLWHDRVIRAHQAARRSVAFYERGLARLEDRWAGGGEPGERFADPHHPYADDLDLFGSGSLFELLCTARTAEGEARLASWLLAPADCETVRARQAAVDDLRPRLDLREELALLGEDVRSHLHASLLRDWGAEEPLHGVATWRAIAFALGLAAASALVGWILGLASPAPLVFVLLLEAGVALKLRRHVGHTLRAAEQPARDLALLGELLARLEAGGFEAPRLRELAAVFETEGAPASKEVARLRRLLELADARRNQLFAPVAALLLWGVQLGLAIESWRQRVGRHVGEWIDAVGEIEALVSLASHAYEHPGDPFPVLDDARPGFDAGALGHPLLAESACVRNDVRLEPERSVLVISGSNMSGKSTLLRSVGTNAVLAFAGAPVRAARLALSPLAVGASIRLHDSLQEGESRFYAEIKRLRQIVDLARERPPALFLLDEILHGTNSHDRGVGAAAVVRGLVERGALGLVTTHDLALAGIADELAPRATNVHFVDHVEDGRIAFDYRLREGVVTKSNALALMREVGLDV